MMRLLLFALYLVSPAVLAMPWPTMGGSSGRQHKSMFSPHIGAMKVKEKALWDPCASAKGVCYYSQEMLSDGKILMHWSSALGLTARSASNLTDSLWTIDLGNANRGCAAFDMAQDGALVTHKTYDTGKLVTTLYHTNQSNFRIPPVAVKSWGITLGSSIPRESGVTCFAQMDATDSSSILFAVQAGDSGLMLRWVSDENRSLPLGLFDSKCVLFDRDPIVMSNGTRLGLLFSCRSVGDTLAVYDIVAGANDSPRKPVWTGAVGLDRSDYANTRTMAQGSVVAFGRNDEGATSRQYGMYDASTGKQLWAYAISARGAVGGFMAAGEHNGKDAGLVYQYGNATSAHSVIAMDAEGKQLWSYEINEPGKSVMMTMSVWLPDGGALVCYFRSGDGANVLLHFDSTGKPIGQPFVAGKSILVPVVSNLLVLPSGDVLLWLGGTYQILRIGIQGPGDGRLAMIV